MKRKDQKISDEAIESEKALYQQPGMECYVLSLFVAGSTPKSLRAVQNIRAICRERLRGRYDLKVIDIYQHPEQVKPEHIVVTPTLIKMMPLPFRILIGDLSNKDRLLWALDLVPKNATL
jgi:circadian clock protein KaiB